MADIVEFGSRTYYRAVSGLIQARYNGIGRLFDLTGRIRSNTVFSPLKRRKIRCFAEIGFDNPFGRSTYKSKERYTNYPYINGGEERRTGEFDLTVDGPRDCDVSRTHRSRTGTAPSQ